MLFHGLSLFYINSSDEDKDCMYIQGDSAWSPMIGLAQVISKEFQCTVSIDYEEPGNDFGGESVFENGELSNKIVFLMLLNHKTIHVVVHV